MARRPYDQAHRQHPHPGKHRPAVICGAVVLSLSLHMGWWIPAAVTARSGGGGAIVASVPLSGHPHPAGEAELRCYQFSTHTARHCFCGVCGIYTHHQRRPIRLSMVYNLACLEGVNPFELGGAGAGRGQSSRRSLKQRRLRPALSRKCGRVPVQIAFCAGSLFCPAEQLIPSKRHSARPSMSTQYNADAIEVLMASNRCVVAPACTILNTTGPITSARRSSINSVDEGADEAMPAPWR